MQGATHPETGLLQLSVMLSTSSTRARSTAEPLTLRKSMSEIISGMIERHELLGEYRQADFFVKALKKVYTSHMITDSKDLHNMLETLL